jgi:hypothetical protein
MQNTIILYLQYLFLGSDTPANNIVTCRSDYRRGFGLDDWIYWTLFIHTVQDYRQYSAIAILHPFQFTVTHALGFSVFTSRILAVDISQSHCNFKSHVKSSFHSIILFLPIPKTRLNSIPLLQSSYSDRLASRNSTLHSLDYCSVKVKVEVTLWLTVR